VQLSQFYFIYESSWLTNQLRFHKQIVINREIWFYYLVWYFKNLLPNKFFISNYKCYIICKYFNFFFLFFITKYFTYLHVFGKQFSQYSFTILEWYIYIYCYDNSLGSKESTRHEENNDNLRMSSRGLSSSTHDRRS